MESRILEFIAGLRASGLQVSLSESADAFRAIESIGVKDRQAFQVALRSTLVKNSRHLTVFNELFPIYFGSTMMPSVHNSFSGLNQDESKIMFEILREFEQRLKENLDRLARGELLSAQELERIAKMVGLTQANDLRYQSWMVQRMKKALRFQQVEEVLGELAKLLADRGMDETRTQQIVDQMLANQDALATQIYQYAGQRILKNMSNKPPAPNLDTLITRPFNALSENEMKHLRREVQRIAKILKTRISLRQRRAHGRQLDAKATIRANLKHGSVPMIIKHRERSLKPRLVVLCDISTSMRFCSELMLSLLYHLQDQISKTMAFVFINHLEYISPRLIGQSANQAVREVLRLMPQGHYNTDLGSTLEDLEHHYLDMLDNRTTLIIVGDGRNNFNDPRTDILVQLVRRSRRTIWLNPEASSLWGSGDSNMLEYAQICPVVLHVSSLAELTTAVDNLFASQ